MCQKLMEGLAGPGVKKNKMCIIPKCTVAAGCPTNTTRCLECVQPHGAHASALKHAGCTDAMVTQYCADMGKKQPLDGEQAVVMVPKPTSGGGGGEQLLFYDGPLFRDDALCFCDTGYTGTDCSKQTTAAAMKRDNAAATAAATVTCPDGRSTCPAGSSCASLSTGGWGCCAAADAVMCDCGYCCPKDYLCNTTGGVGSATHCEKH